MITVSRVCAEFLDHTALLLIGVLSLLFGILILLEPGAGALAIVPSVYALAFGVFLLVLAFRLRGHRDLIPEGRT